MREGGRALRRTKIVATLGPAIDAPGRLAELFEAGVDVARVNLSHGSPSEHRARVRAVREAAEAAGRTVAVMLDTRGPEVRLGDLPGGAVRLEVGQRFSLYLDGRLADGRGAGVSHPGLGAVLEPGRTLLLDDGAIVLAVERVLPGEVRCRVTAGGTLVQHKKLNVPGAELGLPFLSPADRADLASLGGEADLVAASFAGKADDVWEVRAALEAVGSTAAVIAKLESRRGVDRLEEVLGAADGLMVARGDLGVELAPEEVPLVQKLAIDRCRRAGKPVITATQMLESMVAAPRPTRAEASDVANAILDGTDAVMLSEETATGAFPLEAVRVMARIAVRTEEELLFGRLPDLGSEGPGRTTDAVSRAACRLAEDLAAQAILTATHSGHTARMVAKHRPRARVVAVTPDPGVARRLAVVWGVEPLVGRGGDTGEAVLEDAVAGALARGAVREGDLLVLTAGTPVGVPGTTNLIRVLTVGEVLLRGTGLGWGAATGPVRVLRGAEDAALVRPGEILAGVGLPPLVPAMRRAAGVVAEEAGLTSPTALLARELGVPAVVGASGAAERLSDGEVVTLDGARGLVYRGRVTVR